MRPVVACLTVFLLTLAGCAHQGRDATVPAGKMFVGRYINITAPQSEGWQVLHSSGAGMVFARRGQTNESSFAASVNTFELAPTNTPAELEAVVREGVARDTDPIRFEVREETLTYSRERGYPCVRYQMVATDKAPKGASVPLLLEMDGLYCRHPLHRDTGFAAIYSHRGATRYPALRREADAFIDGVQVPAK